MEGAKSAAERKAVIAELCRMFAFSQAKAYKVLKEAGWQSGRKERKDAGSSGIAQEELKLIASVLRNSVRKNGKATMGVPLARSILQANGITIPIADSRLRELLAENSLSLADANVPRPHRTMRTLYPNQVHQADPSVCLIWFAPNGEQNSTMLTKYTKIRTHGKENSSAGGMYSPTTPPAPSVYGITQRWESRQLICTTFYCMRGGKSKTRFTCFTDCRSF